MNHEERYEIEYKTSKNAQKYLPGDLDIDLEAYTDSYGFEVVHSGAHSENEFSQEVYPHKEAYVQGVFHERFGKNAFMDKATCKAVIEEIDCDVKAMYEEENGGEEEE